MRRRSYTIMAAVMAGLVLGIIFAPTFGSSTANAQTVPPTTTTTSPFDSLRTMFLDKLAAALNIQRSALDTAIVTAGNGTADEAVTAGTMTQEQSDALKAKIQEGDLGALFGGRGGGRGGHGSRDAVEVQSAMLDAAATTLNITSDELKTQLSSGQTIAQLATAHNTTEQAVVDAALAAARTKLSEAVTAGTITQEQADARYAELQAKGADLLSHRGGARGDRGARSATPETPAAPTATTTPDL